MTNKLSACVITCNEADRIVACIDSLSFCDEVLVVDSGSTDATRDLAMQRGARVIDHAWAGYRSQKQFAVDQAQNNHVLCIDADERVTAELRAEIEALRAAGFPHFAGWSIPRVTEYCGRFMRHGNAYPDRITRLFDRRRGGWAGYEVHESVKVTGPVGRLAGHLEHFSYRDLDDHLRRMTRYATLVSEELFRSGRRVGAGTVLLRPLWRFIRGLVFKRGLLDGWRGVAFHFVEARYVHEKYLRLWLAGRQAGRAFAMPALKREHGDESLAKNGTKVR